jgi:hypothetical protein
MILFSIFNGGLRTELSVRQCWPSVGAPTSRTRTAEDQLRRPVRSAPSRSTITLSSGSPRTLCVAGLHLQLWEAVHIKTRPRQHPLHCDPSNRILGVNEYAASSGRLHLTNGSCHSLTSIHGSLDARYSCHYGAGELSLAGRRAGCCQPPRGQRHQPSAFVPNFV